MPKAKRRQEILTVRVYTDEDPDLYAWLQSLGGLPFGAKAQAIKGVLRAGLGRAAGAEAAPVPRAELDLQVLLPEIRRVVEAGVETGLARYGAGLALRPSPGPPEDGDDDDDEAEALLALMDESLVLT